MDDFSVWSDWRRDSLYRSGRGKADYDVALGELAKSGISQQEILWASEDEFLKKRSLRKRLKGLRPEGSQDLSQAKP
jgi:hypothetical protein